MKKWISNGAEHSFSAQLFKIYDILNRYLIVTRVITPELIRRSEEVSSDEEEFEEIRQELLLSGLQDFSLWELYGVIDVAKILMCIDLEMRINKLCYYNLNNDVFEAIEKLDIVNKLIVTVYLINKSNFKGTKEYEYIREFKDFRNSFAHGKVQEIAYKEKDNNEVKKVKIKDNRITETKYEILFDLSLLEQLKSFMIICDKYIMLTNYFNDINQYEEDIYDLEDKHIVEQFIDYINKRLRVIELNLELDDDIKGSLQLILNKLYIDIIKIK
ncbi:hypothetical protein ACV3NG_12115 [Clostridium perfringens]